MFPGHSARFCVCGGILKFVLGHEQQKGGRFSCKGSGICQHIDAVMQQVLRFEKARQ